MLTPLSTSLSSVRAFECGTRTVWPCLNSKSRCNNLCIELLYFECRNQSLLTKSFHFRLWSALSLASWLGKPKIVEIFVSKPNKDTFLEEKDKNGQTALHLAAKNGHQNALLLLLNAKANYMTKDNYGNTPLHLCAGYGHLSCTKALLYLAEHQSYDLNISSQNFKGDTPLHLAGKHGFINIVKLLVEYGADRMLTNQNGETPSCVASSVKIKNLLI